MKLLKWNYSAELVRLVNYQEQHHSVWSLNSSSLPIFFQDNRFDKDVIRRSNLVGKERQDFQKFLAEVKLNVIESEFYPPNDVMEAILWWPPTDLFADIP